ncbi:Aste57867_14575 [Aphanomyces stellatus]|uniref:Aste57867_14575 protein n=1 Tax=Aphanomyces stellatus TaxID=120398 RepID=A0A485L124_9STRA|nr:hypothetical protein As57867_014521 [Aphanomyces stellatus]VFT91394.1 Aste57867_14575 [Aphanomyces stellatus]
MARMGVKHSKSTAYRAQTDGQTERQNRTLEDSLRCMCSYHGDDWARLLPMMELAHIGLVQSSHGLTPFEVDTGRKLPNLLFDSISELLGKRKPTEVPVQAPTTRKTHGATHIRLATLDLKNGFENVELKFCRERQETIDLARENLLQAQRRQKEYYDKKRACEVQGWRLCAIGYARSSIASRPIGWF